MFYIDANFVLALVALGLGAMLILTARVHKDVPTKPCGFIGVVIVILSIFIMLLSGYGMTQAYLMKRRMASSMQHGMGMKKPYMTPKMNDMMKKATKSMKKK